MDSSIDKVSIEELTDIKSENYDSILEFLKEDSKINDLVDASFHFIKYHDCKDREDDFLKILRKHIVQYCFAKSRYGNKEPEDIVNLAFEAREKFFNPKDSSNGRSGASRSGELGEIALYFLLESFLKAPQIVSKMFLKTTSGENYKGSDGLHFGILNGKKCLFYCESKLNKDRDKALSQSISSVIEFHNKKVDFEVSVINNHIEIHDSVLKEAIIDFLDPSKDKLDDWIEVNACFVGYNWTKFVDIETKYPNELLLSELKESLKQEVLSIKKHLEETIKYPEIKQHFYFFVIPFKDIDKLRTNFMNLLYGAGK